MLMDAVLMDEILLIDTSQGKHASLVLIKD
jgi:hypothetical protein